MNRRAARLALPLALVATLLMPASAPAADEPCLLAEDAPAYLCAEAGTAASAMTVLTGRGFFVMLYGFEAHGPALPSATVRQTGGCLLIESRLGYTEGCGLDFDVTIDPLLETATIKATGRDKRFGALAVDVTISATQDARTSPGTGLVLGGGCADGGAGMGAGALERPATASGVVRIGAARLRADGNEAVLWHSVGGGGFTRLEIPCAEERALTGPFWLIGQCAGFFAEVELFSCNVAAQIKQASVEAKNKSLRVRAIATEVFDMMPYVPDPTWFDPSIIAPSSYSAGCLTLAGRGFSIGMCGDGLDTEIDPVLRTARITGTMGSPFDGYGPFPRPRGMPKEFDFGRVHVDLHIAAVEGDPHPVGRAETFAVAGCSGSLAVHDAGIMQADATAAGYIAFTKRHGSFRGWSKKPLAAAMNWSQVAISMTDVWPNACNNDEYY